MNKTLPHLQDGYIIITTTIILGVVILVLTLSAGLVFFFSRRDVLDASTKERSFVLAQACQERALLKLASNPNYTGNETITVDGGDQCQIISVTSNPPNKIIRSAASINGIISTIRLTVDETTLNPVAFQEE